MRSGIEHFKGVSYFLLFHPSVSSLCVMRSLIHSVHNYGAPRVTSGITSLLRKRERAAIQPFSHFFMAFKLIFMKAATSSFQCCSRNCDDCSYHHQ